jgi:thermostable 8-oxoguanine DNA glycosylase
MTKVKKSEYIIISRKICKKLLKEGCFGEGSMYPENLIKGLSDREFSKLNITIDNIKIVLEALVKQKIICKKKKERGWKYYLNRERLDKIMEIVKESGRRSIIPILLTL